MGYIDQASSSRVLKATRDQPSNARFARCCQKIPDFLRELNFFHLVKMFMIWNWLDCFVLITSVVITIIGF